MTKLPRSLPILLVLGAVLCLVVGTIVIPRSCAGVSPRPTHSGTALPDVKAEGAILVEALTGTVLWSKAPDRRLPPASCTKIMTALIVLEHVDDLTAYATVPSIHLPQTVGIGLQPGERITIEQALRALIVKSANDAALTLATYVAGDEATFVTLMNARAQQLGLSRTHFENCRGTPSPGHVSTARDLATLGRFAMRNARFRELAGTRTAVITWPPDHSVHVRSHNRLLRYPWGDGVKTGATPQSGTVLVGSGSPGLVPLIVVTMHEPNRDREERDAVGLLQWGSAQYVRKTLVAAGDVVTTVRLAGGGRVALVAAGPLTAVVRTAAVVKVRHAAPPRLSLLPPSGTAVGRAAYWADGVRVGTIILVAAGTVPASPRPSRSASASP
ncbi:MAG: D-alanyl-D-alanine carboxypeptidase [Actinobacteria bacterium]|nr:D-alanyl-D-alanine carboxypeptidase [Actinomycetota bacterium]